MTRIHLSSPDVGHRERDALMRAFDSGWVAPAGPELDGFEGDLAEWVGWPGVVALSSGTSALHLALLALGVGPGDDVVVSTFTFAASANAVTYCGASPVFVDSDQRSWNMSPQLLADALAHGRRTGHLPKAVVVVDLYGQCADYDAIVPLCREYGVPVVEDAAEALAATYHGRNAGTLGDVGVFSFNGNKIITTSGGGAFLSPTAEMADRVRHLATQARLPAAHYEHIEIGFNYRLSNLLAAMGRAQLVRLPELSLRRLHINAIYRELLADLEGTSFMPVAHDGGWNGWLTCMVFDRPQRRDLVLQALAEADIESRPLWKPMHLQPVFADRRSFVDGTSESLFRHGLCLPSGSSLADVDVERVAVIVRAAATEAPASSRVP
jgi:dTDP-4-amino-4,6-dideoxygalactose transaminase